MHSTSVMGTTKNMAIQTRPFDVAPVPWPRNAAGSHMAGKVVLMPSNWPKNRTLVEWCVEMKGTFVEMSSFLSRISRIWDGHSHACGNWDSKQLNLKLAEGVQVRIRFACKPVAFILQPNPIAWNKECIYWSYSLTFHHADIKYNSPGDASCLFQDSTSSVWFLLQVAKIGHRTNPLAP